MQSGKACLGGETELKAEMLLKRKFKQTTKGTGQQPACEPILPKASAQL